MNPQPALQTRPYLSKQPVYIRDQSNHPFKKHLIIGCKTNTDGQIISMLFDGPVAKEFSLDKIDKWSAAGNIRFSKPTAN